MYRSMFFILSQIVMLESFVAIAHAQANQPPAIHRATSSQKASVMKISIEIDGRVVTGTLDDSAAASDFASLLPLMLSMKDYASTEKISDLPRRLSPQGAPAGLDPSVGDITYYAPWGNLAIFYGDADYARLSEPNVMYNMYIAPKSLASSSSERSILVSNSSIGQGRSTQRSILSRVRPRRRAAHVGDHAQTDP